ncbi:hypothetical protein QQP08_017205 [Theobroma cacao]|nr:hypothetical protein QQP08_017205 [Theobroma cacao]
MLSPYSPTSTVFERSWSYRPENCCRPRRLPPLVNNAGATRLVAALNHMLRFKVKRLEAFTVPGHGVGREKERVSKEEEMGWTIKGMRLGLYDQSKCTVPGIYLV